MKLNKYIYKKITEDHEHYVIPTAQWPITEEDVEEWIAEWYKDIYQREPPVWLVGDRWYDRKKRKQQEAEE